MAEKWIASAALIALSACGDKDPSDSAKGDDTAPPEAGPCAGGGWGAIADPNGAIHVRADGDDAGDGTAESPFLTLNTALAVRRGGDPRSTIALGPGAFEAGVTLASADQSEDGSADDGLQLAGCSPDETQLLASEESLPVILVNGADGITITGLSTVGGTRSIWIERLPEGASTALSDVRISGATQLGIVVDGPNTLVDATRVEIEGTIEEEGLGYGIAVVRGTLWLSDSEIRESAAVGIFASGDGLSGSIELDGVTVDSVSPVDDRLGRGIHLQNLVSARVTSSTVQDTSDAGIFGLLCRSIEIEATAVDGVEPSLAGSSEPTGDGIVVTAGNPEITGYDPADYAVTLIDNESSTFARAGILLEGVAATAAGNTALDEDGDPSLYAQNGAEIVGGTDTVKPLKTAFALDAELLETATITE